MFIMMAEMLKVSTASSSGILFEGTNMRKLSTKTMPRVLTRHQEKKKIEISTDLLERMRK
jgi:hypothetical protein